LKGQGGKAAVASRGRVQGSQGLKNLLLKHNSQHF
jgi:hypothetical protein